MEPKESQSWIEALSATCPLFRGIGADGLGGLVSLLGARRRTVSRGESFLRAGESADRFAIVLSGSLVVVTYGSDGRRTIVKSIGAMEPVALAQAFSPGGTMRVGVEADEDAVLLVMETARIVNPRDGALPELLRFTGNLLSALAAKTLELNFKLEILSHRTTAERLLAYLRRFAAECGSDEFEIPFDRQELADFLCVERSALSAEIGRLVKRGVITSRKRRFRLL